MEYIDQKQNKQLSIKLKKKKTNFVIFMDLGNILSFNWNFKGILVILKDLLFRDILVIFKVLRLY